MRGKDDRQDLLCRHGRITPPRMRGKGGESMSDEPFVGITPAYAGKSVTVAFRDTVVEDHPRVCGEKRMPWRRNLKRRGSPPRMRGKEPLQPHQKRMGRITPAYAGKSQSHQSTAALPRDHPRVCGEKKDDGSVDPSQMGSPPRMRGKDHGFHCAGFGPGITPAYAGKRHSVRMV